MLRTKCLIVIIQSLNGKFVTLSYVNKDLFVKTKIRTKDFDASVQLDTHK